MIGWYILRLYDARLQRIVSVDFCLAPVRHFAPHPSQLLIDVCNPKRYNTPDDQILQA